MDAEFELFDTQFDLHDEVSLTVAVDFEELFFPGAKKTDSAAGSKWGPEYGTPRTPRGDTAIAPSMP